MTSFGVVIGCDKKLEHLIPIWLSFYQKYNHLPVTFIDFGITDEMQNFCRKNFNFIKLENQSIVSKNVSFENVIKWELLYSGEFWNHRSEWFKKPKACLLSPYDYSLWIDLDCLVYQNISSLFDGLQNQQIFSIRAEGDDQLELEKTMEICFLDETTYNSGVILFSKLHPLLTSWAHKSLVDSHEFIGDQHALSRAIYEEKISITLLQKKYNWSHAWEDNSDIVIHHFHGCGKVKMIEKFKNAIF